jgi:hypothetical protein
LHSTVTAHEKPAGWHMQVMAEWFTPQQVVWPYWQVIDPVQAARSLGCSAGQPAGCASLAAAPSGVPLLPLLLHAAAQATSPTTKQGAAKRM